VLGIWDPNPSGMVVVKGVAHAEAGPRTRNITVANTRNKIRLTEDINVMAAPQEKKRITFPYVITRKWNFQKIYLEIIEEAKCTRYS
jgi:hypothetical protein